MLEQLITNLQAQLKIFSPHSAHPYASHTSFIGVEVHPDEQRIKRIGVIGAVLQAVFFVFG
jgi:hypothetical protein